MGPGRLRSCSSLPQVWILSKPPIAQGAVMHSHGIAGQSVRVRPADADACTAAMMSKKNLQIKSQTCQTSGLVLPVKVLSPLISIPRPPQTPNPKSSSLLNEGTSSTPPHASRDSSFRTSWQGGCWNNYSSTLNNSTSHKLQNTRP